MVFVHTTVVTTIHTLNADCRAMDTLKAQNWRIPATNYRSVTSNIQADEVRFYQHYKILDEVAYRLRIPTLCSGLR